MSTTPTLIFLDLPPKTFIGIDLASFNSAPNFYGIHNIPPGLHFIYTGTDASLSIRHGRWLNLRSPATQVLQWNPELEHLDLISPDSSAARNAQERLPDRQRRGLIDYAALVDASTNLQREQSSASTNKDDDGDDDGRATSQTWTFLTSYITPRLISRILSSTDSAARWTLTSVSSAPTDTEDIPGLTATEAASTLAQAQTLHLLPVDLKQTWPDSALGRDRTIMARDRSWYLSHLIAQLQHATAGTDDGEITQPQAAAELLGEIQFCFLMVLCLANYSCLEQWKRMLAVLFTCRRALGEVEAYFAKALKVLTAQLRRVDDVEGGLFEMADEVGSKWLRQLLRTFRGTVDEEFEEGDESGKGKSVQKGKQLKEALGELETWLRERYGWEDEKNVLRRGMVQLEDGEMVEVYMDGVDEDEETGEYAPVVVET